jgi:DNA polymerase-1
MHTLTLDVETTTYNKGNPFDPRNFCVTIQTKVNDQETRCKYYDEPDFTSCIRQGLDSCKLIIGQNIKFDVHWLCNLGLSIPTGVRIWDTMVAEFILSGQTNSFASLNSLAEKYGLPTKHDEVKDYWDKGINTHEIPRDVLITYGAWDVDLTYLVYLAQLKDPRMTPKLHKLILLDGADLLVLQEMEYNGLKYNKEKSLELAKECRERVDHIEKELLSYAEITKLNFDSDDQLSAYLYGGSYSEDVFCEERSIFKSGARIGQERVINRKVGTNVYKFDGFFTPLKGTALKKEGLYSTAGDVLKQLKARSKLQKRIIELLLERADKVKLTGTYYEGLPKLMEEMNWGDTIHGQYNQVIARTGRLSSSKPNMQNNPPEADYLFISRYY